MKAMKVAKGLGGIAEIQLPKGLGGETKYPLKQELEDNG